MTWKNLPNTLPRVLPAIKLPVSGLEVLYGLSDSRDACHHKFRAVILNLLIMTTTTGNQMQYYRRDYLDANYKYSESDEYKDRTPEKDQDHDDDEGEHANCQGMLSTYVEDLLYSENEAFKRQIRRLDCNIQLKKRDHVPFTIPCLNFSQNDGGFSAFNSLYTSSIFNCSTLTSVVQKGCPAH